MRDAMICDWLFFRTLCLLRGRNFLTKNMWGDGRTDSRSPLLHLNNTCYLSHKFQRKAGLNAHDVAFWQVATCISAFTFKLILGLKTMGPQAKKVSLSNTNCDNMMYMRTTIVGSVATYWSCFTKNNSPWIKLSLCAHWIFIIEVVLNLQLRKSQSSLTICL